MFIYWPATLYLFAMSLPSSKVVANGQQKGDLVQSQSVTLHVDGLSNIVDLGKSRDIVDNFRLGPPALTEMQSYSKVRGYLESFKAGMVDEKNLLKVDAWNSPLTRTFHEALRPVCATSPTYKSTDVLIGHSLLNKLDIPELLELAVKSSITGHTLTIDASRLDAKTVADIALMHSGFRSQLGRIAPQHRIRCVPRELQIHTAETSSEFHAPDTNPDVTSLGTLIIGLNSDYTGGELLLQHNSWNWDKERVSVASRAAAIRPDCTYSFTPVTSGARVSLVYNIQTRPESNTNMDATKVIDTDLHSDDADRRFSMYRGLNENWYDWGSRKDVHVYHPLSLDEAKQAAVVAGVHAALQTQASIVITLAHLYSDAESRELALREGDRALHSTFTRHFDVEIVAATLFDRTTKLTAALYSPAILNEYVRNPPVDVTTTTSHENYSSIVVAHKLTNENILEHHESYYSEYDTVYIVSGLKISKKE